MKTLNKLTLVFAAILFSMAILSSCQKEENLNPVTTSSTPDIAQQAKVKCYFNTKSSCDENLAQDAGECAYVSGEGKDFDNRFTMVDMLDNCHTQELPSGCSWAGNVTTTEMIDVPLNGCCSPFNSLNSKMMSWRNTAINNAPANNYLVIGYEALGGIMANGGYGPYMFRIRVTYRKRAICLSKYVPTK